jgi:hypothetical protein
MLGNRIAFEVTDSAPVMQLLYVDSLGLLTTFAGMKVVKTNVK